MSVGGGEGNENETLRRLLRFPHERSDGDASRWPSHWQNDKGYVPCETEGYRKKLAAEWSERDQIDHQGVEYELESLPDGYATFEIGATGGGPQKYKRLFGHPSNKFFDSIVTFSPHFFWLLDNRQGQCSCKLCNGKTRKSPVHESDNHHRSAQSERATSTGTQNGTDTEVYSAQEDRPRRQARMLPERRIVDAEGNRNVYKEVLAITHKQKTSRYALDYDLIEDECIDWLAEQNVLLAHLTRIQRQHSFIPRVGELVLWVPNLAENHHIVYERAKARYRLYNFKTKSFVGRPRWRGGVVIEVPIESAKDPSIDFPDLLDDPPRRLDRNAAGFRIETMVDVNQDHDKSLSKQYKYVSLKQVRPFSHWQRLLVGMTPAHLHPSVLHALACMTSISTLSRYKFQGDWDRGKFLSRGLYIGSELIVQGDTVRLVPSSDRANCTDVLVVDQIRMNVRGLNPEHFESKSWTICTEHHVTLTGQCYTSIPPSAHTPPFGGDELKKTFREVGIGEYGSWWPTGRMEVSYDQVIGRLYEADAMLLWSGKMQNDPRKEANRIGVHPDLSYDYEGVMEGRKYATQTDERIPDVVSGAIRWIVSDSRAQALTLQTINGITTTDFDLLRTPLTLQSLQYHALTTQGKPVPPSLVPGTLAKKPKQPKYYYGEEFAAETNVGLKKRGRKTGSKLIDGKVYTAEQLAENPDILATAQQNNSSEIKNEIIVIDDDDSESEEPPTQSQSTGKRSSQMVAAALGETYDEGDDHSLIEAVADQLEMDGKIKREESVLVPGRGDGSVRSAIKIKSSATRSRIMQNGSVTPAEEADSESTGDSSDGEDNWDSQWADVSKAQGGTDESENGDYDPSRD